MLTGGSISERRHENSSNNEAAINTYEKGAGLEGTPASELAEVRKAFGESGMNGAGRKLVRHLLADGDTGCVLDCLVLRSSEENV